EATLTNRIFFPSNDLKFTSSPSKLEIPIVYKSILPSISCAFAEAPANPKRAANQYFLICFLFKNNSRRFWFKISTTICSCKNKGSSYLFLFKTPTMIRFFKRKTELEFLQVKYNKLLRQAMETGRVNRSEGDRILAEANVLLQRIEELEDAEMRSSD
ncbi:MAG TPA: hypothetical protein DCF89_12035, partial [Flavobacteriales bacterium]|nr:hypothetical protein [Flavobacteriales bacterium]